MRKKSHSGEHPATAPRSGPSKAKQSYKGVESLHPGRVSNRFTPQIHGVQVWSEKQVSLTIICHRDTLKRYKTHFHGLCRHQ